jgi:hypothetical protein
MHVLTKDCPLIIIKIIVFIIGFKNRHLHPQAQISYLYTVLTRYIIVRVPNTEVGRCLGPEGNGVSSGKGGERGPGPPDKKRDKQSTPSKEGGNMEQ